MSDAVNEAPSRPKTEIPRSWAVPAEAVTSTIAVPTLGMAPVAKIGMVIGAVVIAVIAVVALRSNEQLSTVTHDNEDPSPAPVIVKPVQLDPPPLPEEPPTVPEPTDAQPAPKDVVKNDAPVDVGAPSTSTGRSQAQSVLSRSRLAARDGDDQKALSLAEKSVELDDACEPCWRTVAFLRKKTGDLQGAATAKARAAALR